MSEGERAKGGARPSGGARAAPAGRATGSESASVKGDVRGAADVIEAEIESEDRLASGRPEDALVAALNLTKRFPIQKSIILRKHAADVHAQEHITFTITPREPLRLVGQSGCEKRRTARGMNEVI